MLKRLSFNGQVMVLPVVAGVAFVILATVSIVLGLQSGIALQRIDKEFSPAEKNSQRMLTTLLKIQRGMQDAVTAMDEDMLQEVKSDQKNFLKLVESAKQNKVQDPKEIEEIRGSFLAYLKISMDTSRRLIALDDDEDLNRSIKTMSQRYKNIKGKLEKQVEQRGEEQQAFLVSLAQSASNRPLYINIPIILAALIIIILLAQSIAAGTVKSLREASNQLSIASSQLLELAKQTESNMSYEAYSVNEARLTMEGMLGAANEVGQGADSMVESADRSAAASKVISERIGQLNTQAMKISDISEMVSAIADRSDMLALNASLEGARAGKVGRGFAYVGKEMRRLTDTVKDAVKDIQKLANQIQNLSQATVAASRDGETLAVETTETARKITSIAAQQRNASIHMSKAMDDFHEFSQQAAGGAKQAKNTAIELVHTANSLSKLVTGRSDGNMGESAASDGAKILPFSPVSVVRKRQD